MAEVEISIREIYNQKSYKPIDPPESFKVSTSKTILGMS